MGDSQSTEVGSKIPEAAARGTKRRCIRHFAEPHAVQIQTVRFWQHLPAAVAPAPLQQVQSDPVKPWRSTKSPVWCPYSPSVSTSWLRRQPPIPATSLPPASPSPTPAAVVVSPRLRSKGKKRRKKRSLNRRRILTVKVTLPVTVGIRVTTMRPPKRKNKPRQQPQQN